MKNTKNFWTCVIGPVDQNTENLPNGADLPMRVSVQQTFYNLTGHHAEICRSGWGNHSVEESEIDIRKGIIYAIEKTNTPEPTLIPLTKGELMKLITNFAKEYSEIAPTSVTNNSHMNELKKTDKVEKVVTDAVITDFVNYVAGQYGIDYAFYSQDLSDSLVKTNIEL
jgi:hypothetical protein